MTRLSLLVKQVFTFEVFFALFLFSGIVKNSPRLAWIPVDLTLLFLGLSFLAAFFLGISGKIIFPKKVMILVLILVLFECWACLSLFWSPSSIYGRQKALLMFGLGIWAFVGSAVLVGLSRQRVLRFLITIVCLSIWMSLEIILFFRDPSAFSVVAIGSNYLGLGRMIGLSILALVAFALWGELRRVTIAILVPIFVLLVSAMFLGGGRGPLVAVTFALIVPAVCDTQFFSGGPIFRKRLVVMWGALSLIPVAIGILLASGVYLRTVYRLWVLLAENGGYSGQTRLWFYGRAIEFWMTSPFVGNGLGSWPILMGYGDTRGYPHNMVLEILVEMGAVGLGILVFLIVVIMKQNNLVRLRTDSLAATVFMLTVYTLINAMFSGDLTDNRIVFAMLGLLAGLPRLNAVNASWEPDPN